MTPEYDIVSIDAFELTTLSKYSKDFGIDIHAKDNDGRTAWHMACFSGQTETAQLII